MLACALDSGEIAQRLRPTHIADWSACSPVALYRWRGSLGGNLIVSVPIHRKKRRKDAWQERKKLVAGPYLFTARPRSSPWWRPLLQFRSLSKRPVAFIRSS